MLKGPNSLSRRLLLASLICLPLYLAATGWFLSRSFKTSQLDSTRERLRVQFYALLGALEFDSHGIIISPHNGDPRLREPNSGLYAIIEKPQGELLWQSPSSEGLSLTPGLLAEDDPPITGQERFETLAGRNGFLRYQYQTTWETEDRGYPAGVYHPRDPDLDAH